MKELIQKRITECGNIKKKFLKISFCYLVSDSAVGSGDVGSGNGATATTPVAATRTLKISVKKESELLQVKKSVSPKVTGKIKCTYWFQSNHLFFLFKKALMTPSIGVMKLNLGKRFF